MTTKGNDICNVIRRTDCEASLDEILKTEDVQKRQDTDPVDEKPKYTAPSSHNESPGPNNAKF